MRIRLPNTRTPFPFRRSHTSGRKGKFRIWPLLLFGLFFLIYTQSHQETVPLSGRTQIVDMSRSDEVALGLQSYRTLLSQSDVISSGNDLDRIRSIGKRIAAVTGVNDFKWEFNLIRSEQANAFALPGGKVAIYTGILPITQNDDGLAAVMGHEIAHATSRHGAERMTHQRLTQLGGVALNMAVGEMAPETQQMVLGAFGLGSQFGILLPFSRKHESEADYIGLLYLARACFNPREAPLLWGRMQQAQGSNRPPEFLSTHPTAQTRIEQFKQWMPEALRISKEHCNK